MCSIYHQQIEHTKYSLLKLSVSPHLSLWFYSYEAIHEVLTFHYPHSFYSYNLQGWLRNTKVNLPRCTICKSHKQ
jgi:hypothetical protein